MSFTARFPVSAGGVALAAVLLAAPAVAQAAPGPSPAFASRSGQAAASVAQPSGTLYGVSCPRTTGCMAVGSHEKGRVQATLAMAWNGKAWRALATPNRAGSVINELSRVACARPSSCLAVGWADNGSSPGGTELLAGLAQAWNGTRWRSLHPPHPAGSASVVLTGVSCTDPSHCMVAGTYFNKSQRAFPFAEQRNGHAWRLLRAPSPRGALWAGMNAVSCTTAASCMAFGSYGRVNGAVASLAEAWNGHAWRLLKVPSPPGLTDSQVVAISCTRARRCMAVGDYIGSIPFPLTETWKSGKWHLGPRPHGRAFGSYVFFGGVSCTAATSCLAVGSSGSSRTRPVAEQWNGASMRIVAVPAVPRARNANLNDVSCVRPTACVAVGNSTFGSLAMDWNRGKWRIMKTPGR